MGHGKGRLWPLRREFMEAGVLDGVEWEGPGLRSGPKWTPSWPLAGWPPAACLGIEGFAASRDWDGTLQCLSSLKSLSPPGLRLIIPPTLSRDPQAIGAISHVCVPPGQLPRVDPSLSSISPLSPHPFLSPLWSFLCGAQWGPSPSSRIVSNRKGFWKQQHPEIVHKTQCWKERDLGQFQPVCDARRQERGEGCTQALPRSQEREMQKERNPQILNSCQDVSPTARQASHCLKAEVGCGVE